MAFISKVYATGAGLLQRSSIAIAIKHNAILTRSSDDGDEPDSSVTCSIMNLQAGLIIKSTPALAETYFAGAVIFLTEYNTRGAVGFVINRPFGRSLNELEEFKNSLGFPLYDGGPVDQEHLFFLHRRPDIIEDGIPVGNGIYWSGNFSQAVEGISNKSLSSEDIKIFIGYCGWDAGELETEIAEGSWVIAEGLDALLFN